MNYQKIYNSIIERAKSQNRQKNKGIYYEEHHILPRGMGGSEQKENKVLLTAKEHYIAHILICKIYPHNKKMLYAIWRLVNSNGKQGHKINASEYQRLKEKIIELRKKSKGWHQSEEFKKRLSNLFKGIPKSKEHKLHLSQNHANISGKNNPMYGKKHSKETRKKISNKAKLRIGEKNSFFGKQHSKETKRKISEKALLRPSKYKYTIYCFNNKKTYIGLGAVENDLKINYKKVSKCCKGFLENVNGYRFKFI